MTPEQLVERINATPGVRARSIVLYGSAAAGDHAGRRSDFNVLVVLDELGLAQLDALADTARAWARAGNPPPLLMTLEQLEESADVFPVEFLDIKENHRVLSGEDVPARISVDPANLRLQIEHELRSRIIHLREQYLLTGGRPRLVEDLMVKSLSTFLVLFRAALRLFEDAVPARKLDALKKLAGHIACEPGVFEDVHEIKTGRRKLRAQDARELFGRYLAGAEKITRSVNAFLSRP